MNNNMDIFEHTKELFDLFDYVASQLSHLNIFDAVVAGFLLAKNLNSKELIVQEINAYNEMCKKWDLKKSERIMYFSGIIQKYFDKDELNKLKPPYMNDPTFKKSNQGQRETLLASTLKTNDISSLSCRRLECNEYDSLNRVALNIMNSNCSKCIEKPIDLDLSDDDILDLNKEKHTNKNLELNCSNEVDHDEKDGTNCEKPNGHSKSDHTDNVMHIPTTDSGIHPENFAHKEGSESLNHERNLNNRLRTKVFEEDKEKFVQSQLMQSIPCVICAQMITGLNFATNRCGHSFHHECIKEYLTKKLSMGRISYKCPANRCAICMEFK